ncbi:MAG: hypothetical protein AAGM45_13830, partial [Cyanobacteria bacterium J06588_5]
LSVFEVDEAAHASADEPAAMDKAMVWDFDQQEVADAVFFAEHLLANLGDDRFQKIIAGAMAYAM